MAAYLDDVIVFDSDPTAHVKTTWALFTHLPKYSPKLSPSKGCMGATDADFLGHAISPASVRPTAEKHSALVDLIKIPMPRDLRQVLTMLGGVGYYRKFLHDLSKWTLRITSLLRESRLSSRPP